MQWIVREVHIEDEMHINCVQEAQISASSDPCCSCTYVKDNTIRAYVSRFPGSGEWILFEFTHAIVITKVRIEQHIIPAVRADTIEVLCSNSDVGPWTQIAIIAGGKASGWIEWP